MISIVTPSFNQAQFLEDTIRSVLTQDYQPIEYVLVDGGSTDGSIDIIKKYSAEFGHWQSAPDEGQSWAINKGFEKTKGEIMGWINSDDYYHPGVFRHATSLLDPARAQILIGNCVTVSEGSTKTSMSNVVAKHATSDLEFYDYIIQPSTFWTRKAWDRTGPLDENLKYVFDWDWFIRARRNGVEFITTDACLSAYRIHEEHKSSSGGARRQEELAEIYRRYHGKKKAALFQECLKRKKGLQRIQKRIKGLHLKRWELQILKTLHPVLFSGLNRKEIEGILAMI